MLRETEGYLSGQEISERIGVSRTSVWKSIRSLKEEGYPIEAVTRKGYRLLSAGDRDIYNAQEIENCMHTAWAGHPLVFLKTTGSTNEDAFRASDAGSPHGTLVVTGQQTAGKGRRGREWISPPDENIYMSILLKPSFSAERAPMLTLIMALAVYEAVEDICAGKAPGCQFGIKWPNDLVVSVGGEPYRKCCGILTEMRLEDKEIRDIVIGTGINVNQTQFPPEIRETATSIYAAVTAAGADHKAGEELAGADRRADSSQVKGDRAPGTGEIVNRAALTGRIWERFEALYEDFAAAQSMRPFLERYEKALVNRGRKVRVLDPAGPYEGTARGITEGGDLIVAPADGSADRLVGSGEVSVRGVSGYA